MPTIIEIKLIIVILIQKLHFFMLFLLKLESIQVICWWESKPGKVWIIIHGRKGQGMPGHHRKSGGQLVINMSNNMEWAGEVECFKFNRNAFIISFWDKYIYAPSHGLPPCCGGGAWVSPWSCELSRQRLSLWQVQPSRKDQWGETRQKGSQKKTL